MDRTEHDAAAVRSSGPLLLGAVEAAAVCGVSRSTFNAWVRGGVVPPEVRHPASYGGWPRYSRVLLEQWLARG